jgi:phosphatidylserine decarboxylase
MTSGNQSSASRRVLAWQSAILALCGLALFLLCTNFPYPSPLAKPFLAPKQRWPTEQVMSWVEQGQFDADFAHYFARDPERKIPAGAALVSPADGIVQNIATIADTTFLVVGLSFWDVHVVRTPVAGTVKSVEMEGAYLERLSTPARVRELSFLRGKEAPVQAVITLATARGDVKVRMITSYWASRLKVWVYPGRRLAKGERIGRIVLGSTVVTEFPGKVNFDVPIGVHVLGGETAVLQH